MALESGRKPAILDFDQGCGLTSCNFAARPHAEQIKISWTGRMRCYDNILAERLRRPVKHGKTYLLAYSDGYEAEIKMARFL